MFGKLNYRRIEMFQYCYVWRSLYYSIIYGLNEGIRDSFAQSIPVKISEVSIHYSTQYSEWRLL